MNRKTILALGAGVLIILVVFGIYKQYSNGASNDEIKIGILNPSTGELANYADQAKRGIELAIDEYNNEENKIKFSTIYEDTKGESKTAISALNKLINFDKVNYFVGDISSTVTLALVPIIEANKKLLFSPGAATPKLSNISKFFVRNWPSNDLEATSAAEYAYSNLKFTKCAIVYVNNDWGIGLKNGFENSFTKMGGVITSSQIYNYEEIDFKNTIAKLKTADYEVLYLAGNQKEMGNFIKQYRENKINKPVISNTSFMQDDCLKIAGSSAEGVVIPTPEYNPQDSMNLTVYNFYKLYKQKYPDIEPTLVDANGYDAIQLIIKGITEKGNNPELVADYIRNKKGYLGAGGKMDFVDGDVIVQTSFKKIKNGKAINIEELNETIK